MDSRQIIWTVSIIAQYNSEDEIGRDAYNELERSILMQKRSDSIRYVIFFYDQKKETGLIKELKFSKLGIPWFEIIKEYNTLNFYSGTELTDFFNNHVSGKESIDYTKKYLILTWGHGAGLGFFFDEPKAEEDKSKLINQVPAKAIPALKTVQELKSFFSIEDENINYQYIYDEFFPSWDDKERKQLVSKVTRTISAVQFRDIISSTVGKADVLLTMNCYMQCFETAYALRNVVNLMISPQTTISFYGYNYKSLFTLLIDQPNLSLKDIADNVIDTYSLKYREEPIKSIIQSLGNNIIDVHQVSISANDLTGYNEIYTLIDKVAAYLINNFNKEIDGQFIKELIDKSRRKCMIARLKLPVVDFKHFFNELSRYYDPFSFEDDRLLNISDEIIQLRKTYLLSILQPGSCFEPDHAFDYLPSHNPQFFSIFFPYRLDNAAITLFTTLFRYREIMNNSKWSELLAKVNNIPI